MTKSTERVKKYRQRNPWHRPAEYARRRCTDPNHKSYAGYGGRGIQFLLVKAQIMYLWFRDKAYKLEQPSLDRIDPDGHYDFRNSRFIELVHNVARRRPKGSIEYATPENQKDVEWEE